MNRKVLSAVATAAVGALILSAGSCSAGEASKAGTDVARDEQTAVQNGLTDLRRNQPIPQFTYSQILQTLIDVETAQAQGTATTTAFYLEGVGLVEWCPSIGLPVASTSQLSNSTQYIDIDSRTGSYAPGPIEQAEPTGVYVGDSSGTYTLCVDDAGKPFAHYWEGYVSSDVGARSYPPERRVVLTGDPTMTFGTKPG